MAKAKKKSIRLPQDIKHGSAWWTPRGYARWEVTIGGRTKVSECKDPEKAFAAMRKAITFLMGNDVPEAAPKPPGSIWRRASIREWCEEVLEQRARHLEETTRDLYRNVLSKWVYSINDWAALESIDKGWTAAFHSRLLKGLYDRTLSHRHYRNICSAFGLCLRKAAEADYLPQDFSPLLRLREEDLKKLKIEGMIKPKGLRGRRYVKTEDWLRLLRSFEGSWFYGPLLLGSYTGLRTSEVAGLKWEAVDLVGKIAKLTVENQVRRIRGKGLKDMRPKYNSIRDVKLLPPVVAMLNSLERRSSYVFLNSRGNLLDHSVMDAVLKQRVERLELRCLDGSYPVFTDLARKALATEGDRHGVDAGKRAAIAGHALEVQEGVYTQDWRDEEELAKQEQEDYDTMVAIYAARLKAQSERKSA